MKMKLLLPGMILLAVFQTSCKKNKVEVIPEKTPDIYISGYDSLNRNVYWKNGVMHQCETLNPASMVVNKGDVYFVNGKGYQKNGVQINLPFVYSLTNLFVSGEDVYAVGHSDSNIQGAFYWKNDQIIKLNPNISSSHASLIVIKNNKVYVAGYNGNEIFYWSDGIYTSLGEGKIYKMEVEDSNVYILGLDNQYQKTYWKNGYKRYLRTYDNEIADIRDIFVNNGDVYVVGYNGVPLYWKNDQPMGYSFFDFNMIFKSIAVYDDNVYVI